MRLDTAKHGLSKYHCKTVANQGVMGWMVIPKMICYALIPGTCDYYLVWKKGLL